MFERYEGLTHLVPYRLLPLWQRVMCRRQWHAFDEVASSQEHYLSCDACGLSVNIDSIDHTYFDPSDAGADAGASPEGSGLPAQAFSPDLLDVMTPDQACIWWSSPQSVWSGSTPSQMLPRIGADAVVAEARRIARGDYA